MQRPPAGPRSPLRHGCSRAASHTREEAFVPVAVSVLLGVPVLRRSNRPRRLPQRPWSAAATQGKGAPHTHRMVIGDFSYPEQWRKYHMNAYIRTKDAMTNKAQLHELKGDLAEAERQFREVLAEEPLLVRAFHDLGGSL